MKVGDVLVGKGNNKICVDYKGGLYKVAAIHGSTIDVLVLDHPYKDAIGRTYRDIRADWYTVRGVRLG